MTEAELIAKVDSFLSSYEAIPQPSQRTIELIELLGVIKSWHPLVTAARDYILDGEQSQESLDVLVTAVYAAEPKTKTEP